ncbi:MAG: hypothetical protein ACRCZO_20195 [Cetobacterium sp.]
MNSHINGNGMGLSQKSYENTTAIVKHGEMTPLIAGVEIPAKTVCGINYTTGKVHPYNEEATDGTEIPRYFSDDGCKINEKVPFMRGGELWDDRIGDITIKQRELMKDLGFKFIKANKGY